MYTEDYLLRMIRRLAEAIARKDRSGIEDALQESLGLSIGTLDALPASALLNLLRPGDDLTAERIEAVAGALEALGGEARLAKAAALRQALQDSGGVSQS